MWCVKLYSWRCLYPRNETFWTFSMSVFQGLCCFSPTREERINWGIMHVLSFVFSWWLWAENGILFLYTSSWLDEPLFKCIIFKKCVPCCLLSDLSNSWIFPWIKDPFSFLAILCLFFKKRKNLFCEYRLSKVMCWGLNFLILTYVWRTFPIKYLLLWHSSYSTISLHLGVQSLCSRENSPWDLLLSLVTNSIVVLLSTLNSLPKSPTSSRLEKTISDLHQRLIPLWCELSLGSPGLKLSKRSGMGSCEFVLTERTKPLVQYLGKRM